MIRTRHTFFRTALRVACFLLLISCSCTHSIGVTEHFDFGQESQNLPLQRQLSALLPDTLGLLVTGPMTRTETQPGMRVSADPFRVVRVICPDLAVFGGVVDAFADSRGARHTYAVDSYLTPEPNRGGFLFIERDPSFRGAVGWDISRSLLSPWFLVLTVNQNRYLIWQKRRGGRESVAPYSRAVSDYLYSLDTGWLEAPAPKAVDYGLPDSLDFYADPPPYVIEGYDNYKNFLNAHDTIRTDFAYGLTEFVPSDSLWEAMKANAPKAAFPNKEWPMLQHEYKKFVDRGGDVRVMQILTHKGFDTLHTGEYFFAVSVAGKVRFGRELQREEVAKIEAEAGKKVPRANHAFLFPGEPVMTAGAFFIEEDEDSVPHIVRINAQSGHFFYSNVSPTIREDISERSDYYLTTLGHFFVVLDSLDIPHDNVVISKM